MHIFPRLRSIERIWTTQEPWTIASDHRNKIRTLELSRFASNFANRCELLDDDNNKLTPFLREKIHYRKTPLETPPLPL